MLLLAVCLSLAVFGVEGQNEVAFSAGLTHHTAVNGGETVVYDRVFSNEGNGYSSDTGKFTCPQNGLYVFEVHSLARNNSDLWLELHQNYQYVMSLWGHTDNDFAASGNTVVLQLSQGDVVSVVGVDGYYSELYGDPTEVYATFSGFLVSPVFQEFAQVG